MPTQYDGDTIVMKGVCAIEDVDELMKYLQEHPHARVDLTGCEHMHTALLQLLMHHRVSVLGNSYSPFIWKWVTPMLAAPGGSGC